MLTSNARTDVWCDGDYNTGSAHTARLVTACVVTGRDILNDLEMVKGQVQRIVRFQRATSERTDQAAGNMMMPNPWLTMLVHSWYISFDSEWEKQAKNTQFNWRMKKNVCLAAHLKSIFQTDDKVGSTLWNAPGMAILMDNREYFSIHWLKLTPQFVSIKWPGGYNDETSHGSLCMVLCAGAATQLKQKSTKKIWFIAGVVR